MNIRAIQTDKLATLQNPTKSIAVQAAATQNAKQLSLTVKRNVENKNLKIEDKAVISTKAQALLEQELASKVATKGLTSNNEKAQEKTEPNPNPDTVTAKDDDIKSNKPNDETAQEKIVPNPNPDTVTAKNDDIKSNKPNNEKAQEKIVPNPSPDTVIAKNDDIKSNKQNDETAQEKTEPNPNPDAVQAKENIYRNNKNIQTVKTLMGVLRARRAYA